ncbi:MAG TPA: HGxxPAAW family protein [Cellulomonas sp.]|uniref:HGxxPAAW family protein n=1 Tax=Cellulomonas sp. TaxID=40001 RepID=UPI002E32C21A|nr:HGxxPAAW family protein [Cellulomonas sp.]HEX5331778.1 HGxxPAAW family protein [Cellulomonas sp.]
MADQSVERRAESAVPAQAPIRDLSYLPPSAPPANHGHTTAAWTTVIVVLVGAVLSSVAMIFAAVPLVWAGGVIIVLGIVAGKVLQILGYGQGGAATLAKQARSGGH